MTGPDNINVMAWPANHIARVEHVYRYARAKIYVQGARVVDAACGFGYGTEILREAAAGVYALDRDAFALAHARIVASQLPGAPVVYEVADLDTVTLPETDVVVSIETIEHLTDPERWMAEMKRGARRIIYSVPITPTKATNPHHLHDFTTADVERWAAGWHLQWMEVQANNTAIVVQDRPA